MTTPANQFTGLISIPISHFRFKHAKFHFSMGRSPYGNLKDLHLRVERSDWCMVVPDRFVSSIENLAVVFHIGVDQIEQATKMGLIDVVLICFVTAGQLA